MISSRQEPDDAASPPLSLEEFDHGTDRPRLRRIARKVTDSGAELPAAKTVPERKRNETTNRPASIEESSKRGLKRVAPKSDSNAERRRKKLARIREELIQQRLTGDSVLASRVTAAIRNSALPVPRENKRKKSRKGVGWVLDSKAVAAALDSRVAAGSSSSSDAQAVSVDALQAEIELRRIVALSTASFQLDASPSIPVLLTSQPQSSTQHVAADVREVAAPVTDFVASAPKPKRTKHPVFDFPSVPVESLTNDPAADFGFDDGLQLGDNCGLALVEPPPPEIESYRDWFKRVVVRNRWLTWFTTFYIHWALLLLLTAIIVHGPDETVNLLLDAAFAMEEEPSTPFEMTVPVAEPDPVAEPEAQPDVAAAEEAPKELSEEQVDISDAVLQELAPKGVATAVDSAASEAAEAKASPRTNAPQIDRSPATATRQGSFSVWTEPANPRPGDPYRIIIQVRLPEHTKKYLVTDLEGVVVGSDGYRNPVPGFVTGELPIVDGYARLAVPIVSADKKVRDTVFIRSRLLRETQKLMIDF